MLCLHHREKSGWKWRARDCDDCRTEGLLVESIASRRILLTPAIDSRQSMLSIEGGKRRGKLLYLLKGTA